jgi:hypothetical protein
MGNHNDKSGELFRFWEFYYTQGKNQADWPDFLSRNQ